ncbi:MAG TPA: hypothetical protein VIG25_08640 [Pyrinomonadaceae bacterium]|jgi:hypothetical protein
MSPLPPSSDSNTNWRDLYRAALLELDPTLLAQRVAEAEGVIIPRARELFLEGDSNCGESEELNDALHALRALGGRLKSNTSAHQVVNHEDTKVA